jgi:hypothetical protein
MMLNTKYGKFLAEDDGGGMGGGGSLAATLLPPVGAEAGDPSDEGDTSLSESTLDSESQVTSVKPAASPQQVMLDPTSFAAAIKAAGLGQQAPAAPQFERNKPLTAEEIAQARKALNFWEPDDAFFTEFNNMDTQKQAFSSLRDGMTQQFATMMQAYFQDQSGQLRNEFNPALQFVSRHDEQKRMDAFDGKYPDLAKPELRPLLNFAADALRQQGKTYDSQDKLFSEVAEGMAAIIRTQNPDFKLSVGSSPAKKPNLNAIKPAPGGGGGGGGGNVNAETGPGVPLAVKFLPKVRG